jgi:hypothetical protein
MCLDRVMEGSATVHMAAPADKIWDLIADIRNTGRFSPETFEAEWLDGATGPALGADSAVTSGETALGRFIGRRAK